MRPNRHLTFGGYLMALYLITVPLAETLIGVWPLQLGDAAWRYGATGLLSQALMTPLLGLLLAVYLAVYVQHRALSWALAVVSGLVAVFMIAVIPLFLLDMLEMRAQVGDAVTAAFDVATGFALLKMGAAVLVCFVMARGARSAAQGMRKRTATKAPFVSAARVPREEGATTA